MTRDKTERLGREQLDARGADNYGFAPAYDGCGVEELVFGHDLFRSFYVYEHGADEKDFADYCGKLELYGFEVFSSGTSNGNLFATYFDGENIVNVSYIKYTDVDKYVVRSVSYVLIAVDSIEYSALPCAGGEYKEITTVMVSLVAVTAITVRLTDGRFLVIDGGMEREKIYRTLVSQNVLGGKPVVAAWLFSHSHCDHIDGFFYTLEDHSDEIVIERIIHEFPGEELYLPYKNYMEGVPNSEGEKMGLRVEKLHACIEEKMPGCLYTTAHAGQRFEFPGVKVEVLQTSENLYKKQMIDTNMSSVIYMLTMPHGKLLLLGDAVDASAKILRKIYGPELKCDAVVLAHHGYNGGDEEMYANIGARAAIWPLALETIKREGLVGNIIENHFDFNSVEYNFMKSCSDGAMTLYHGMPADEIERFTPRFEVKSPDRVCYEKRKNPQHFITEEQALEGYGDAPRYYGKGEEGETFRVCPDDKTYEITIGGVTEYEYRYYFNSFKRDGYVVMDSYDDGDSRSVTFADLVNEVLLSYSGGVIRAVVGPAGKNVFDPGTMRAAGGRKVSG